jgi:hypothetical protein
MDIVKEKSESLQEKLLIEYDKIMGMQKIKKIIINKNIISFFTTEILCTDDRSGIVHSIGEFAIIINLDSDPRCDQVLRFHNLTRKVQGGNGMHFHPHIPIHGHACQGNLSHTLPKLLSDLELEMVLLMCINFLESANTADSWGRYINVWPVKENPTENQTVTEVQ